MQIKQTPLMSTHEIRSQEKWDVLSLKGIYEELDDNKEMRVWFTEGKERCHQFSSVAQSCLTLCDPMDCSTAEFPVHHQLPELTQIHVH